MNNDFYLKVLNKIIEESESLEEFSGAGAIGGVATPLGSGPSGKVRYKSSSANDKKYRNKSKKKKNKTVQYYLRRKRLNESLCNIILEGSKTPRLDSLTREEIISFIDYLLSQNENHNIHITEKISGQHITIGVEGSPTGNRVYAATKDSLGQTPEIFSNRFFRSKGSSGEVKRAFIKDYPRLNPGERKVFQIEVIKNDERKPDYIAYGLRQTTAAVYKGDMTAEEAKALSSRHVKFLSPEDIVRNPLMRNDLSDQILVKLEDLKDQVRNFPDKGFKKFIKEVIEPAISSLVTEIFGGSILNAFSPLEGLAVNFGDRFLKIPTTQFSEIQRIQSSLFNEFKSNRYNELNNPELFNSMRDRFGNHIRANMLYDFINSDNHQGMKQSFGYKLLLFIKMLPQIQLTSNLRIFFNPEEFSNFCEKLYNVIITNEPQQYYSLIFILGRAVKELSNWHTTSGNEDYNNEFRNKILELINV